MKTVEQILEYWTGEKGLEKQDTSGGAFPDADVVLWVPGWCEGMVCEVGCGVGRVSALFDPDLYIGADISAEAVGRASAAHPRHSFVEVPWDSLLPAADTYLFYTVLLHIPDAELSAQLGRMAQPARVVVYESMSRALRANPLSDGFAFQRDPEEYIHAFRSVGMTLKHLERRASSVAPGFRDLLVFGGEV